jgi:hypothetical protein
MRDGEIVYSRFVVQTRVSLSTIERSGQWNGEFTDEAVIRNTKIAEFECETNKMGDEVGCVYAAVDKDCAVDVRVMCRRVDGRLEN